MSRHVFPDAADRLVYIPSRERGGALLSGGGLRFVVCADPAGDVLADIRDLNGNPIPQSVIGVAEDSRLIEFLGPEDSEVLYLRSTLSGGETVRITPRDATASETIFDPTGQDVTNAEDVQGALVDLANEIDVVSSRAGYVYEQGSPASVWTINHDLGYDPAGIQVVDSSGEPCEGVPVYTTPGSVLTLIFNAAFGGKVRLS